MAEVYLEPFRQEAIEVTVWFTAASLGLSFGLLYALVKIIVRRDRKRLEESRRGDQ